MWNLEFRKNPKPRFGFFESAFYLINSKFYFLPKQARCCVKKYHAHDNEQGDHHAKRIPVLFVFFVEHHNYLYITGYNILYIRSKKQVPYLLLAHSFEYTT